MGNVTLPTPVAAAGGALCLLGGYLLGVVAGPDAPTRTTAVVESYDSGSGRLCLREAATADTEDTGSGGEGLLCGTWRRARGADAPEPGDTFRFVSMATQSRATEAGEPEPRTLIYGGVVGP